MLYVGQLVPHKGVHTAIEAVRLARERGVDDLVLTIVGGSVIPEYEAKLRSQVVSSGLESTVTFFGPASREQLPAVFQDHGVLLLPSCWGEPFAITPLEAMASGLLVIGTTSGGSGELLVNGENALTFPEERPDVCAQQIVRAVSDAAFCERLADAGYQTVQRDFGLDTMADRLEEILHECIAGQSGWQISRS